MITRPLKFMLSHGVNVVEMAAGSKVLSVAFQTAGTNPHLYVWMLCPVSQERGVLRTFYVAATGDTVNGGFLHCGTAHGKDRHGRDDVLHVFEDTAALLPALPLP